MIDGVMNNVPTVAQLEQDVKDGKTISILDLANVVNSERKPKQSVIDQLKPIPHKHKKEKRKKKKQHHQKVQKWSDNYEIYS